MKLVGGLGTAAVALALCAPSASGATWTVTDSDAGGCGPSDSVCKTIQEASNAANPGDTIQISPGIGYAGATFTDANLTVEGTGFVVVLGTLGFSESAELRRVIVRSGGNSPAVSLQGGVLARTLTLESTIVSGDGTGAGVAIARGVAATDVVGRHVTIADAGAAPAVSLSGVGSGSAAFHDSIVLGGGTFTQTNSDVSSSPSALFVAPDQEFFFLRVGSPAIDAGEGPDGSETNVDVEGETRPPTSGWDRGADEFLNHPPGAPGLVADRTTAGPGQQVVFGAVSPAEPDASRGDGVAKYRFDFGDGSGVLETTNPVAVHAYAAPGQYTATARTVDVPGAESAPSNTVTITVAAGAAGGGTQPSGPDNAAPRLAITSPRRGQAIRIGRRTPNLRGTTSDASGVRRVELALMRRQGRICRWYDGRRAFLRRPCGRPVWFRATIDDFAWRYVFPRRVRPVSGSYVVLARATDVLGNTTARVSAAARTAITFRYRR